MKSNQQNKTRTKILDDRNLWQGILGPLPIGTKVRFKDKRCKKGYVDGEILSFCIYYSYKNRFNMKNYSYVLERIGKGRREIISKRPHTLIKVLNGQKRKKDVRR